MSWDARIHRSVETARWNQWGRPAGAGPDAQRWKVAEARQREEDRWLAEQYRLAGCLPSGLRPIRPRDAVRSWPTRAWGAIRIVAAVFGPGVLVLVILWALSAVGVI